MERERVLSTEDSRIYPTARLDWHAWYPIREGSLYAVRDVIEDVFLNVRSQIEWSNE